jgi:S-formylglutathione hydrolase FrmB
VLVLLPAGYENSSATRYPVVELLHGAPGTPPVLVSLAKLAAAQAAPGVRPFIGLVPDGYEPKGSWFANLPGDSMGAAVTNDLRTWAARRFRVNTSWSYAGLSSGGIGAMYLPLISSFAVHASCALSGHFDGNMPVLARARHSRTHKSECAGERESSA